MLVLSQWLSLYEYFNWMVLSSYLVNNAPQLAFCLL